MPPNATCQAGAESLCCAGCPPSIQVPPLLLQCLEVRTLIVGHLRHARTPILLDDSVNAYLVVGFRVTEEGEAQYRVLDPHYGMRYAQRGEHQTFDPALGPDQYGADTAKDQWVCADWVEQASGCLNGYTPKPMWMALLIG